MAPGTACPAWAEAPNADCPVMSLRMQPVIFAASVRASLTHVVKIACDVNA